MAQQRRVADTLRKMAAKTNSYDLFTRAQELGFQWGIINSPEDVLNDPHFKARGFPVEVEHPELGESFTYPGAPYSLTKSRWRISNRAPLLGEHNEQVYVEELGMSEREVAELKADGVI